MKIFLSYSSKNRPAAEEISLALTGDGHDVFFDRTSLRAGGDYQQRIRAAIAGCEQLVFLITPDSVRAESFALTELEHAKAKWPHPKGHVVPVLLLPTSMETIPAYLKAVTILEPVGNVPAAVVDAVAALAADAPPAPARPLWKRWPVVLGGATVLVGAAAAVIFKDERGDDPKIEPPPLLNLRFSYQAPAQGRVVLDAEARLNMEVNGQIIDGQRLALQDGGYYSYPSEYPVNDVKISGRLFREVRESQEAKSAPPATFCLQRPASLEAFVDRYVHLDCADDSACRLHDPSPRWLDVCPAEAKKTSQAWSLFTSAQAAEVERRWSVPSASTLASHQKELKGVGYTIFEIETDAFRDPAVIGVEVGVRVNGTPIYEDGVEPALRPVPYSGKQGSFKHQFALEVLDFEGALAGCEAIELALRPRKAGGSAGAPLQATLAYVSLRNTAAQQLPFGGGSLQWSARYVVPADEWSNEAFITSTPYVADGGAEAARARQQAVALKAAFDRLGVQYQGQPLIAVIRPPLSALGGGKLAYGITAGIRLPSGQVRFTFPFADADRIADTMLAARATLDGAKGIIAAQKYIYKAAGNAERRTLPTPPGVCAHVKTG